MALVTTDIVSKGYVETVCSALVLEKDMLVVDNKLEVLHRAWVAASKGQSLVMQHMQTDDKMVRAAHKEELATLRWEATENDVLSSCADNPSAAAALLVDLRKVCTTQIKHLQDILCKATLQHKMDLRDACENLLLV